MLCFFCIYLKESRRTEGNVIRKCQINEMVLFSNSKVRCFNVGRSNEKLGSQRPKNESTLVYGLPSSMNPVPCS